MKKLIYLFLALIIVACSDDEGNPCVYNPTLTTSAVTNITETAATLNGMISIVSENCDNPNNSEQGFVYATTIQPTTANNKVNVNGNDITTTLENLESNTTYYVRAFLINSTVEFYGNEVSFLTSACAYNLNTLAVTNITPLNATLNGTINIEDSENCELPNTEQGFVYAKTIQPTINDTQVNVNGIDITTTLENLEPNTIYYVRTFLTNSLGEFYGNEVSFTTEGCEVVYLDSNGTTIKAYECAEVGETGVISGVTYTVVDETMLRQMIVNNEDVTMLATTKVTNMSSLFNPNNTSSFNQPIGNWDVSNVTDMEGMFRYANAFNQDLSNWDVSNVIDMNGMFYEAYAFNQPIGNWNMSNVRNTYAMFGYAEQFNQDIGDWDVSSVLDMFGMFFGASSFNKDISNWNVNAVNDMEVMFKDAEVFNQDLSSWNVEGVSICFNFSTGATAWTLPKPNFTNCSPN